MQQEIVTEAVTRGVDQHSRFLTQIAARTPQILNVEKLAADAQASKSTTRRYLEIWQDTRSPSSLNAYSASRVKAYFWRSVDQHEVDYVLNDRVAIEVKHTTQMTARDLKGLKVISDNHKWERKIVISQDPEPRNIDDIDIPPVRIFLQMLWNHQI